MACGSTLPVQIRDGVAGISGVARVAGWRLAHRVLEGFGVGVARVPAVAGHLGRRVAQELSALGRWQLSSERGDVSTASRMGSSTRSSSSSDELSPGDDRAGARPDRCALLGRSEEVAQAVRAVGGQPVGRVGRRTAYGVTRTGARCSRQAGASQRAVPCCPAVVAVEGDASAAAGSSPAPRAPAQARRTPRWWSRPRRATSLRRQRQRPRRRGRRALLRRRAPGRRGRAGGGSAGRAPATCRRRACASGCGTWARRGGR